jgi:hypothetical protein
MSYTENKKASGLETLDSSTVENADLSIVGDVSDSSRAKAITFTNIKAFLKTYFDPIYQAILGLTSNVSGTGYTLTGGATPKTLTLSNDTTLNGGTHSGTNTGDQTSIVGITGTKAQFDTAVTDGDFAYQTDLPVKATGAELDTGTNDTKFATAKAIKDSKNIPSVAPGTAGNVLTSDGTDWTSATPTPTSDPFAVSSKPGTYLTQNYTWLANGTSSNAFGGSPFGYQNFSSLNTTNSRFYGYGFNLVTNSSDGYLGQGIGTIAPNIGGGLGYIFSKSGKKFIASFIYQTSSTGNQGFGVIGNNTMSLLSSDSSVANRACFRLSSSGTVLQCITDANGGTRQSTTVTTPTMSNMNRFRIEIDQGSECRFYINGSLVATHSTILPGSGGDVYIGATLVTSGDNCYMGAVVTSYED